MSTTKTVNTLLLARHTAVTVRFIASERYMHVNERNFCERNSRGKYFCGIYFCNFVAKLQN